MKDTLEKEMATHSSILAWEILWTGEPGGLQSMGPQKSWLILLFTDSLTLATAWTTARRASLFMGFSRHEY